MEKVLTGMSARNPGAGYYDNGPNKGKKINRGRDVIIGKHVWLGASSVIMKGVNIGNGSIVGMCSLVTKNIPSNCVVAGIPSQIVKEDIYWEK